MNEWLWRYDGYEAGVLASPLGKGLFAGKHTADLLAQSAKLGWMPSVPTFDRNPLELGESGAEAVVDELKAGTLRFACTDPDNPRNWPRVLTVWRANLLGSSAKGNEYFLRHLLGTDASLRANETRTGHRTWWRDEAPRAS